MEKITITEEMQLEIFEEVFLTLLEKPSMRDKLRKMIESYDRVDIAKVDLMLAKIGVGLYDKNEGGEDECQGA